MGFDGKCIAPLERREGLACVDFIRGKRVAIDSAGWAFEASSRVRVASIRSRSRDARWELSAYNLARGRLEQLKAVGSTPVVVLEGLDSHRVMRGISRACVDSGSQRLEAPNGCPGECVCAHLSARGDVDLVWTADVYDCILFGARSVMRRVPRGGPAISARCTSKCEMETIDITEPVRANLMVLAACIGVDFLSGSGIRGVGQAKARRLVEGDAALPPDVREGVDDLSRRVLDLQQQARGSCLQACT